MSVEPLKPRLFDFAGGCGEARVTCKHCGWSSHGSTDRQRAQVIWDRSSDHECPGVESYTAFRERDQRDLDAWRASVCV